ncbi:unnamed protein product [Durusdinium trenchii]|uniref:X8 domain-containing protein n=2 Tax=Durusdinium trenchii TaxID=1381693 RepID=A0ABP0HW81_9DINO
MGTWAKAVLITVLTVRVSALTEDCPEKGLHLLQSKGRFILAKDDTIDGENGGDLTSDTETRTGETRKPELMKGVSYGPSMSTSPSEAHHQDYFCDAAEPIWGGRGDLEIIASLGANVVRLYGNDPTLEHQKFLDHAQSLNLEVIPGMGDRAFQQCKGIGNFSCFQGAKEAYLQNLQKGFLVGKAYHPSIKYFIVVNEPELKLPSLGEPKKFAKAIVSAIDGVLDAEEELGVEGPKPNLTVTFSFAFCNQCDNFRDRPGLGQLWTLKDALLNPEKYGVEPKRNLTAFFETRFTFSFNSGNPSDEIQSLFLDHYEVAFPSTPIFVAEYHNPGNPHLKKDLKQILRVARHSSLLLGISFFEFQNRYDQAGHLIWGMFDPQGHDEHDSARSQVVKFKETSELHVPCLSPVFDHDTTIIEELTKAYKGPGVNMSKLCLPDPDKVLVSKHGFLQMVGLKNVTAMQIFIKRVVTKLGGFVPYVVPAEIAEMFMNPFARYRDLEAMLVSHPEWARWDVFASCMVDVEATNSTVAGKLAYICGLGYVDCSKVPESCEDLWDTASWVFGTHFREVVYSQDFTPKPLQHCYLDGAAQFVRSSIWKKMPVKKDCIVPLGWTDPNKVHISQHGFHLVWSNRDPVAMKVFITRALEHTGGKLETNVPESFVTETLALEGSFKMLQDTLAAHPPWGSWETAACVPDREAKARDVGAAIGLVCSKGIFDCGQIPAECKGSVWDQAAYVFGSYYRNLKVRSSTSPLYDCAFDGRAVFAGPHLYKQFNYTPACIVSVPDH